ncbi:unnamed protein product [Ixodes pacificus]
MDSEDAAARVENGALDEALAQIRAKDGLIADLKLQLEEKECAMRELQTQLNKFRAIMKPLTEQLTQNLILWSRQTSPGRDDDDVASPYVDTATASGAAAAAGARPKRLAISAEPVDARLGDSKVKKVVKSDQ